MTAEAIRITVMAVVRKHRGDQHHSDRTGVFIYLSLHAVSYPIHVFAALFSYQWLRHYIWYLGVFRLPLFLSVYLASEFAFASKSLGGTISCGEATFSPAALAQEQEKQQILTTQNQTLEQQVTERTAELRKASQNQLIQKEKLASLGELTAGIAHEIQNPLNFVNNFSELSVELIGS